MVLPLLLACTSPSAAPPDPRDTGVEPVGEPAVDRFDPDHVLEVVVELPAADWDTLRYQTRSVYALLAGDCLAQPLESPFTWFDAEVTLDGQVRPEARIRKKGLLGSMSSTRPSLKVDLQGVPALGADRYTLNGTPQDPTLLRTCLAYQVYAAAGVPAPRCGFAHVVVNGEDLGIYVNVEPVDEAFLDRAYGEHAGELFEGSLSDLREGWTGSFDPDTADADVTHLQPAVDALTVADRDLDEALAPVVDLDAFHRFWAAEVLVGQWDGYTSNTNNFYVYLGADGRLRFIPWGPDGAFATLTPYGGGASTWAVANAQLPWRLLGTREGEARHHDEVEALLDTVWDAPAMVDEIDRMADLLRPWWTVPRNDRRALEGIVEEWEDALRDSLAQEATPVESLRAPPCLVERGTITSTFRTTWDSWATQDPLTWGEADLSLLLDDAALDTADGSCVAGDDGAGRAGLLPIATVGDTTFIPYLSLPPDALVPGRVAIDGVDANATLYYANPDTGGSFVAAAYIGGDLRLTAAGTGAGDAVEGTLDGVVYVPGW